MSTSNTLKSIICVVLPVPKDPLYMICLVIRINAIIIQKLNIEVIVIQIKIDCIEIFVRAKNFYWIENRLFVKTVTATSSR